jgi:ligand-binding sensor domain-containing protein
VREVPHVEAGGTGVKGTTRRRIRVRAFAALAAALALSGAVAHAAEVRTFVKGAGLPSSWVTALFAEPGGKLWVGTGNAGVYLLDPATGTGKGYTVSDGLASDEVTSIARFQEKVYVGTSGGLSVLQDGRWSTIAEARGVSLRNARLAASPDGEELWASAVILAGGTVRFDGKEWKFMGGEGRGLFNDVQGFAFLPDGVLMGSGSGVPYLRKGTDIAPAGEGLPPVNILSAVAWKGKAYLGTNRGLFVLDGRWREVVLPQGFSGIPVFCLAAAGDSLLAGTAAGLVKVAGDGARILGASDGLPASRVLSVAAGTGYVAAGTANGLGIIREWE